MSGGTTLTTTTAYDLSGRVMSVDGPLPGTDDATYSCYDSLGRRVREIGPRPANGLRVVQRHTYRAADDKVTRTETGTVADPACTATVAVLSRVDYGYDSRRNPIREAVVSGTTPYSLVQRTFQNSGRLDCEARRMNPAVFATVTSDACLLGAQGTGTGNHGPDRITHNIYDAAGQLLQVQRAYRVTTANGFPATLQQNYATFTYSPNGKQTSVTDANGNRAEMTWDGFDRQRRWIFPSRTTDGVANAPTATNPGDYEEYGYDLVGNRTSLRKRDGLTLTYQYDALNRMIRKTVPERPSGPQPLNPTHTRDVFYDYDSLDLMTYARFDSRTGQGVTNDYDGFGRLSSSTINMDGVSRAVTRSRDDANNRTNVTYGGQTYVYDYDDASRLEGVYQGTTVTATALLTGFTYTPRGQVDLRNGKVSSVDHGYDAIGRLTSMAHTFAGGAGNVAFGFTRYNPAGQIVTRTRSNDSYAWTGGVNVNRTYTTNGLSQYTAAGTAAFTYDANGNLTSDGANTYVYDVENRLVGVSGARTANLRYDPLGRLYEVGAATPSRRFLWDGDALVAEYQTTTGTPLAARFVHGTPAGVDDPLIWFGGGENRRLHTDHQGSIVAVTNGSGAATWINAYDEWGIPNADNVGRFQYTGQAWIAELGMYHYKARIYSPTLGRFLQTDPVGYDDQVNLYAYVGNDPVNGIDPTGQYECLTPADCRAADKGADEIRAARNFYRSAALGSRLPRDHAAAQALDKTLASLGTRDDGGVNISVGTLEAGTHANYDKGSDTITLDTAQIEQRGARIGTALGHEIQHRRQRDQGLSPLAGEVRPIGIEYIIGRAIGGAVRPVSGMSGREYIRNRLDRDYCLLSPVYCNPAIDRVMNDELPRPF